MPAATTRIRPRCSVRACGLELERTPRTWRCSAGHSFDVARSGYVNLLQPGDRRSRRAGDSADAVAARERLDQRGVGSALHAALRDEVAALSLAPRAAVLDVGAGTGALLAALVAELDLEGWALDLSVPAVDRGTRRHPELSWVVANADRRMPFADGVFGLLLSTAGPKHPEEFRRLLAPGGALLLTVPAQDDLIELRAVVQGEARREDRVSAALALFEPWFECRARSVSRERPTLERHDLEDLLAASYRGARRAERAHFLGLHSLPTTLSSEILRLAPR